MKMKRLAGLTVALLMVLCTYGANKPVLLTTPAEYQLMNVSPNGKWACGDYVDYNDQVRGFLWNLQSGTFTLLSTLTESEAWAVSNDGTVVGVFQQVFNQALVLFFSFGYCPKRYTRGANHTVIPAHKIYQADKAFVQQVYFFVRISHNFSQVI